MKTYEELIEHIKKNISLKEFAEKHYGFEFAEDKGQKNIMANCKLKSHNGKDSTPSFAYRPFTNDYICYSCGGKGTIIDFVGDMEELETTGEDFINIIKIICNKENIDFNFETKKIDEKVILEMDRRTKLAFEYKKHLWANKLCEAFQYLLSRGLVEQTITDFHLGLTFADEARFGLNNISNRISFPILEERGVKTVGFSYRIINGDDKCKYINNPADEIFQKKSLLYGWWLAKEYIKKTKTVYVVEGQMDMISMYQIGIKNTVAMMTNTMTDEQIQLITKYAKTVIFIIDQDAAGEKGFNSKLNDILNIGLDVKVVTSLNFLGKDINDVCNKLDWDRDSLIRIISSNTVDGIYFKIDKMLKIYDQRVLEMQTSILSQTNNIMLNVHDEAKKIAINNYIKNRLNIR